VIVRIATEGQYRLGDESVPRLQELDDELVASVQSGDEARFQRVFGQILDFVRGQGERLDDDELVESAVILPPPDTSLSQAAAEFSGEGLIPG
jgi:hypothetical protein